MHNMNKNNKNTLGFNSGRVWKNYIKYGDVNK